MRNSPSIVPDPEERKSTWVQRLRRTARPSMAEVDEECTDRGIVITDPMTGQYSNPVHAGGEAHIIQDELQNNYQRVPIR